MMMALEAAGLTDVGLVRNHNEDNLFFDTGLGLFIVADGLGGHAAGEVASKIVVDQMAKFIKQTTSSAMATQSGSGNEFNWNEIRLKTAIQMSNKAIADNILTHPERKTMGSTVVACLVDGKRVTMAHVGDSRAYRLDKNSIQQITRDHSWVAEQVANGLLTKEEAKRHPFRNIITQALGNTSELDIEVHDFEITNSETILLCSDGLSGMVSDEQILEVFNEASNLRHAVRSLVSQAIDNGGEDNVSVVLVRHNLA
ncbi:MAG: Stp1/IreP family PP2C-type Ser/Thr phosphatase [Holophagales bacterium]|jgi:protein phosphatase|nr:Stp1/IreP family PP2C-type Ser/Thr phosphatase [Holophagales bacterium]